jgi:1-acyl-sn-glycerol-3-phosphate acyltransferase
MKRSPTYQVAAVFLHIIFRGYFRWSVFNSERVPPSGPVLLACNHASFLDPPLVGAAITRPIHFLARETLFQVPLMGGLLPSLNCVPVDRDGGGATGLKAILHLLAQGDPVLVFPEGTRTHDGRLLPARSGIGLAVIKSGAPVVPVRVFGTFEAFGRHMKWPTPRPIAVKFGVPLPLNSLREEALHCSKLRLKEIYREAADAIMRAIGQLEPCLDKSRFP